MTNLEYNVRKCYETAPFPDNLRNAKNFEIELKRTVNWITLNLKFLSPELLIFKPRTILCAGCGTGEEAISLAKIYPKSKITAIDISNTSLLIAKQNTKKAKVKNIILKKCSIIEDLPKLKKQYDFVYSAGVIHHLSDPKLGFEILRTKINKNGKMVIMLYNSYGLFIYRCQLASLRSLAGSNQNVRLRLIKLFRLAGGKSNAYIYDTYINPQVTTYSIGKVLAWAEENDLALKGVVPPLNIDSMIKYATHGKDYFFRRKGLIGLALKLSKVLLSKQANTKASETVSCNKVKLIFYQLIFLVLGRGECQYLFTNF